MVCGVCVPQAKKVFRAVSVRGGDSCRSDSRCRSGSFLMTEWLEMRLD